MEAPEQSSLCLNIVVFCPHSCQNQHKMKVPCRSHKVHIYCFWYSVFEFSPFVHELWVVSERIRSDRSDGCVDSSNNLQETPRRTRNCGTSSIRRGAVERSMWASLSGLEGFPVALSLLFYFLVRQWKAGKSRNELLLELMFRSCSGVRHLSSFLSLSSTDLRSVTV